MAAWLQERSRGTELPALCFVFFGLGDDQLWISLLHFGSSRVETFNNFSLEEFFLSDLNCLLIVIALFLFQNHADYWLFS